MKKWLILLIFFQFFILSSCSTDQKMNFDGLWIGKGEGFITDYTLFLTLNIDKTYQIEYIRSDYSGTEIVQHQKGIYSIKSGKISFEYFPNNATLSLSYTHDIDESEISSSTYFSDGRLNEKKIIFSKVNAENTMNNYLGTWIINKDLTKTGFITYNHETITIYQDHTIKFNNESDNTYRFFEGNSELYLGTSVDILYDKFISIVATIDAGGYLILEGNNLSIFSLNNKLTIYYSKVDIDEIVSIYQGTWVLNEKSTDRVSVQWYKSNYGVITFTEGQQFYFSDRAHELKSYNVSSNHIYLTHSKITYLNIEWVNIEAKIVDDILSITSTRGTEKLVLNYYRSLS